MRALTIKTINVVRPAACPTFRRWNVAGLALDPAVDSVPVVASYATDGDAAEVSLAASHTGWTHADRQAADPDKGASHNGGGSGGVSATAPQWQGPEWFHHPRNGWNTMRVLMAEDHLARARRLLRNAEEFAGLSEEEMRRVSMDTKEGARHWVVICQRGVQAAEAELASARAEESEWYEINCPGCGER